METHVGDILRYFHLYDRYDRPGGGDPMKYLLRGRRVDLGAEYMALGASLENSHCAAHLKERATRREDDLDPQMREAMAQEADDIAFGKEPFAKEITAMWMAQNANCVCIPYLQAAQKFLAEHPLKLVETQFKVVNKVLCYVGHPDWLVQWPSPITPAWSIDGKYCLLSIKSGALPNWAGIQESLYLLADPEGFEWPDKRFNIQRAVVQFRNDGGYAFKALNDYRDFIVAEHFAAAYHDARKLNGEME